MISKRQWAFTASAIAAVTLTSAGAGVASGSTTQHHTSPWRQTAGYHQLTGVSAVSPSRAFAVGEYGEQTRPFTQQWDGSTWSKRDPSAGESSGLWDVDALSGSDAWAVGIYFLRAGVPGGHTLTEHWNGHRWRIVDSGPKPNEYQGLRAITMAAPDDVWAVGGYHIDEGPEHPLVKHWDGTTWTTSTLPADGGDLVSVDAVAADDIWATCRLSGGDMVHWDGTAWSQFEAPYGDWNSLSAVSSDDVWAVGGVSKPIIGHWDGRTWNGEVLDWGENGGRLTSVSALSSHDVWAVGYTYTSDGDGRPDRAIIEHWNGHRWRIVPCPHPGLTFDRLDGVSADSAGDAWAVGTFGSDVYRRLGTMMMVHWDGTQWTRYRHHS